MGFGSTAIKRRWRAIRDTEVCRREQRAINSGQSTGAAWCRAS